MSDKESSWSYHLIEFKVDPAAEGGLKQTMSALRGFFFVSSCLFACFPDCHAVGCEEAQIGGFLFVAEFLGFFFFATSVLDKIECLTNAETGAEKRRKKAASDRDHGYKLQKLQRAEKRHKCSEGEKWNT